MYLKANYNQFFSSGQLQFHTIRVGCSKSLVKFTYGSETINCISAASADMNFVLMALSSTFIQRSNDLQAMQASPPFLYRRGDCDSPHTPMPIHTNTHSQRCIHLKTHQKGTMVRLQQTLPHILGTADFSTLSCLTILFVCQLSG